MDGEEKLTSRPTLEEMANQVGTFWTNWEASARLYAKRLYLSIDQQEEWVRGYLTSKYYEFKDNERKV